MDVWWTRHKALAARYEAPVDAALAAGFISDRLGWAFASGYRAALQSLLPSLPADKVIALAVTEAEGGHPRAIQTTLTRAGDTIALSGHKSHITLGQHADAILVLARSGEVDGRPNLELVSVDK
ncbi:MAG: acyl-CoA dehydrogenase, partial [Myxococcota bacterium]